MMRWLDELVVCLLFRDGILSLQRGVWFRFWFDQDLDSLAYLFISRTCGCGVGYSLRKSAAHASIMNEP